MLCHVALATQIVDRQYKKEGFHVTNIIIIPLKCAVYKNTDANYFLFNCIAVNIFVK